MKLWPKTRLGRIRLLVWSLLIVIAGIGGCGQGDRLFYWPNNSIYNDPAKAGVEFDDLTFASSDGTKLHGWYVPHDDPRAIVLLAHGNAGNLSHRAELVLRLARRCASPAESST